MPRFDGTGPWGLGPGTGWGLGPCGAGRLWRRGLRWRRFWGWPSRTQISKEEEIKILENESAILEEELEAIKTRLKELKGQK